MKIESDAISVGIGFVRVYEIVRKEDRSFRASMSSFNLLIRPPSVDNSKTYCR